ncbi:hypothetical protein [Ralstonia solanacearum]
MKQTFKNQVQRASMEVLASPPFHRACISMQCGTMILHRMKIVQAGY